MKRVCMALSLMLIVAGMTSAQESASVQEYAWAVGVRVGGANGGLTVKRNFGATAVEIGVAIAADDSGRLQALYEWQMPVLSNGFMFYYGVGAFVGAFDFSSAPQMGIGIEGVVGLEYKVPSVPVAFSLDYRPGVSIVPDFSKSTYGDVGIGLKYCF